jgi:hypothetical protein
MKTKAERLRELNLQQQQFRASAWAPKQRKIDKLEALAARVLKCDACGTPTTLADEPGRKKAGRSTWKTASGTMTLCSMCSEANRRISGLSRRRPKTKARRS